MKKSAKAFRTISEVADWLDTPAHVLRFWESRFAEITPVKRAGGRRYYRPEDMRLLGGIKHLLHSDGLSIKAVQSKLDLEGVPAIARFSPDMDFETPKDKPRREKSEDIVASPPAATSPPEKSHPTEIGAAPLDEPSVVDGFVPESDEVTDESGWSEDTTDDDSDGVSIGFFFDDSVDEDETELPQEEDAVADPPEIPVQASPKPAVPMPPIDEIPKDPEDQDLPLASPLTVAALLRELTPLDLAAGVQIERLAHLRQRLNSLSRPEV